MFLQHPSESVLMDLRPTNPSCYEQLREVYLRVRPQGERAVIIVLVDSASNEDSNGGLIVTLRLVVLSPHTVTMDQSLLQVPPGSKEQVFKDSKVLLNLHT